MDLSKMSQRDKMRYEVAMESKSLLVNRLSQDIIPEHFEEVLHEISRAEYKRGKADGIAELKQADKLLSSNVQEVKDEEI